MDFGIFQEVNLAQYIRGLIKLVVESGGNWGIVGNTDFSGFWWVDSMVCTIRRGFMGLWYYRRYFGDGVWVKWLGAFSANRINTPFLIPPSGKN